MGDVQLIQWIDSHGILIMIFWIFTSTLVGYLPTPTKDSKAFYKYFFQVCNSLVFQFARAFKSKIENSPNWNDAVTKAINGGVQTQKYIENPLYLGKQ